MFRDPDNREKSAIGKILGPVAGISLEIGCGDGRLTGNLSELFSVLYALDTDPVTIREARDIVGDKARFIIGSGEELPFAEERFTAVVFSLSLHHQNPDTALSEAQRVLQDQGRILILEPEAESPINRLFRLIHNEDEAYARAAEAVSACGLNLTDHGFFTSVWRFDSYDQMVNHLYSFFDQEPDPGGTQAMEDILPRAEKDYPLFIEDSTQWWLLSKR